MCGGEVDGEDVDSREVWRLGLETLAWERLPDLTHAGARHACCVVRGGTLVALGGRECQAQVASARVEVLERGTEAWRELPPLSCGGRDDFCAVAVKESGSVAGQVCTLGGINEEQEPLHALCIVDLATGVCTPRPHIGMVRSDFAFLLLPDGRIIVAGGCSESDLALDSAEAWEPSSGAWRSLPGMGTARDEISGCMLTDGRFAVFGGMNWSGYNEEYDQAAHTESCEALVLDNGSERWEPLPPMLEARSGFVRAAVGGCVIVAGGHGLSSAEVYEEATGVWRRLPCDLPRAMSRMSSALL